MYFLIFRNIFIVLVLSFLMSTSESTFPDNLKDFGYAFNEDGQLRKIDPQTGQVTEEPFEFNVKDQDYNQRRYEALGEVVTQHVYDLLEKEVGLIKLTVPKDGTPPASTFVFASPDIHTNTERLLLLIHGSGVVRAGQWARRLIINDSLQTGTQIPFIKRAQELGYAVLVLNTNDNARVIDGKSVKIKGSESPEEHANYIWKHFVKQMKPKHVAIIAHSYGGVVTLELVKNHFSDFRNMVFGIAFTDSVHSVRFQKVPSKVIEYLQKVARNWAADSDTLDTPIHKEAADVPKVSAGHPEHEMTSWSSFESVFKFIQERYNSATGKEEL